jgi:hypothetical protein
MPLLGKAFDTTSRRELAPGGRLVLMPMSKTRVRQRPDLVTRARNLVSSSSLAPAGLATVVNIFMLATIVLAVLLLKERLPKGKEKVKGSLPQLLLRS